MKGNNMKRIENNLEQQMWFKALALHLPEEVYHQVKDELLKWVKDNFVPLDAVVKYEIAEEEKIVIWGEPLRGKKDKTLDDFSDCKLPKQTDDCDATESDIY